MRIAYIVPALVNKGPVIVVKELVSVFCDKGHECVIYYFDDIVEIDFCCHTEKLSFKKSIDFSSFDVIHTHGLRPDLYIFIYKPFRCNTICVSTMHNFIFKDLCSQYNKSISVVFGRLWLSILKRHQKIIVLSYIALEYYKKWIPIHKLNVIYNTRNINRNVELTEDEKNEVLAFKGEAVLLGVNALLTPIKGVDQIIRSLPFLDNVKLWINGDGRSMYSLQKLTQDLGIEDLVHFAGYKNNAYSYLQYFDIYMMTSRNEGFGLSLLEAVIQEKEVVCSDIDIFRELFSEDEVTFFELENIVSLAEAVKISQNANKSSNAYVRYMSDYSPKCFYERHMHVYCP